MKRVTGGSTTVDVKKNTMVVIIRFSEISRTGADVDIPVVYSKWQVFKMFPLFLMLGTLIQNSLVAYMYQFIKVVT